MKYYVIKVGEPVRDDNGIISNRLELIDKFDNHALALNCLYSNISINSKIGLMTELEFKLWFNDTII